MAKRKETENLTEDFIKSFERCGDMALTLHMGSTANSGKVFFWLVTG